MHEDLTNRKFERLTVKSYAGTVRGRDWWWCECACGNKVKVAAGELKRIPSRTKSCKCLMKEKAAVTASTLNKSHGASSNYRRTPEYRAWCTMKQRCYNENHPYYMDYGGRGIRVCERWLDSFETFLRDLGQRPSKQHSLGRKKNNEHYTPENCRWETIAEQNRNKSTSVLVEHDGRTLNLVDWLSELGIKRITYYSRLYRGWTREEALGWTARTK